MVLWQGIMKQWAFSLSSGLEGYLTTKKPSQAAEPLNDSLK
jgi:hypothetical protein